MSSAKERAELRRARILAGSAQRMSLVTGQSKTDDFKAQKEAIILQADEKVKEQRLAEQSIDNTIPDEAPLGIEQSTMDVSDTPKTDSTEQKARDNLIDSTSVSTSNKPPTSFAPNAPSDIPNNHTKITNSRDSTQHIYALQYTNYISTQSIVILSLFTCLLLYLSLSLSSSSLSSLSLLTYYISLYPCIIIPSILFIIQIYFCLSDYHILSLQKNNSNDNDSNSKDNNALTLESLLNGNTSPQTPSLALPSSLSSLYGKDLPSYDQPALPSLDTILQTLHPDASSYIKTYLPILSLLLKHVKLWTKYSLVTLTSIVVLSSIATIL